MYSQQPQQSRCQDTRALPYRRTYLVQRTLEFRFVDKENRRMGDKTQSRTVAASRLEPTCCMERRPSERIQSSASIPMPRELEIKSAYLKQFDSPLN